MIYSQKGSKDYIYKKNCEREVREFIKHYGGKAECLSWFKSIPEADRWEIVKLCWTQNEMYVSWNDHSYEYFQEKIGAIKPYIPATVEDVPDSVWDDFNIFQA